MKTLATLFLLVIAGTSISFADDTGAQRQRDIMRAQWERKHEQRLERIPTVAIRTGGRSVGDDRRAENDSQRQTIATYGRGERTVINRDTR